MLAASAEPLFASRGLRRDDRRCTGQGKLLEKLPLVPLRGGGSAVHGLGDRT